jgi:putative DNA primase/helicase
MPYTVAELAAAKGLPADLLRQVAGLADTDGGVAIPYWPLDASAADHGGPQTIVKLRTAARARDGSRWPANTPPRAYGEWRQYHAASQGRLILVEGESDCWACWLHDYPALGLPGAHTARCLTAEHVAGVEVLYVAHEPDQAGERFVAEVLERLWEIRYRGVCRELRMPAGTKDVGELLQSCQATGCSFGDALDCCLHGAGRLALPAAEAGLGELCRMLDGLERHPRLLAKLAAMVLGQAKRKAAKP